MTSVPSVGPTPTASPAAGSAGALTSGVGVSVLGQEEKVEYRDEQGNLLNDEQVQALVKEGKATFHTKYETRTRLVDELGNEVPEGFAPAHPDVQGQNPDTKGMPEEKGKSQPAQANAGSSLKKDQFYPPKPASDAKEATKQEL